MNGKAILDRTGQPWPGTLTRKHVKCELKKRNPRPKKNRTQEIFVVFAAMRQGTWFQIVQSRLPKEEKGRAKAKAKARESEKCRWEQQGRGKEEVKNVGPEVTGRGNGDGLPAPSPGETQEFGCPGPLDAVAPGCTEATQFGQKWVKVE